MRENRCVVCGDVVPEGRIICPTCEENNGGNSNMIEIIVKLDTIDKVKEFCNLCSKCMNDVSIYSDRYIVSGKSIMGLLSLDLTKNLKVEFDGIIPIEVKEGMKKFLVN